MNATRRPAMVASAAAVAAALCTLLSACSGPPGPALVATQAPDVTPSTALTPTANPTPSDNSSADPTSVGTGSGSSSSTTGTGPMALPTCVAPVANPGAGSGISAYGDSVMNGARTQLSAAMPGISIQAQGSWQLNRDIAPRIRSLHRAGTLGTIVVIHAGHNLGFTAADVDCLLDELADRTLVVLVTVRSKYTGQQDRNNAALRAGAQGHSNVRVADWQACARNHPEWTSSDLIHLNPAGREPYAQLIKAAIYGGPGPCAPTPTSSATPTGDPTDGPTTEPTGDPTTEPTGDATGDAASTMTQTTTGGAMP